MRLDDGFEQTTGIVTGGARSLGLGIASALVERGGNVVIADVEDSGADAARDLTAEHPGEATFVQTDVTDPAACDALVRATADRYGGVDVLVNNASVRDVIPFDDVTDEDWRRHLAVNLDGTFYCCRAALPALRAAEHGRIVNLASMVVRTGHPTGAAPYVASKAGVVGLTRALAQEVARDGVTVNAVAPHAIRGSGMLDQPDVDYVDDLAADVPVGRLPELDDVVATVLYLLSPSSDLVTGQTLDVNGGSYMR